MHVPSASAAYARIAWTFLLASILEEELQDVHGVMPLGANSNHSNWTLDDEWNFSYMIISRRFNLHLDHLCVSISPPYHS